MCLPHMRMYARAGAGDRSIHPGSVPIHTTAPNDLWTADFKGQFRTRNGIY